MIYVWYIVIILLIVNETRNKELEFTDYMRNNSRSTLFKMYQITNKALKLSILSILFSLYFVILLDQYFLMIFYLILIPLYFYRKKFRSELTEDLMGFVITFDDNNKVRTFRTLTWIDGSQSEFLEDEIRFNQAIGFKVVSDENGIFQLAIIVDENYPGDVIFETMDIAVLAELKHSLNIIFPDKNVWFNDGWLEDDEIDFEEELTHSKVPILLRKYFPVKYLL